MRPCVAHVLYNVERLVVLFRGGAWSINGHGE